MTTSVAAAPTPPQDLGESLSGFTTCLLRCWQDERTKNAILQEKLSKSEEDLQMERECHANEAEYMRQQHEEALDRKDQEIIDIKAELDISRNIGNMSIKCAQDEMAKQKKAHDLALKEKDAEIEELKRLLLLYKK